MIRSDGWTDAAGRPPLINLVATLRWSEAAPPQPVHASGTGSISASSKKRNKLKLVSVFQPQKPHDSWAGGHAEWEDTYSSYEERGSDEDGEHSAPPARLKSSNVALCRRGEALPRKWTRVRRGQDTQIDRHQLYANNNTKPKTLTLTLKPLKPCILRIH